MAILKKALAEDFKDVYPLLLEFNNPRLAREDWKEIFTNHWGKQQDYFGYMLVNNDKVVGFLALIFSARLINDKIQKFCNIGSWIVKKEYRSETALLILPVLKLKEYTLTVSTPSKEVYLMLKKLGFKDLETHINIILPLPSLVRLSENCLVEFDKNAIKGYLSQGDLKIYRDHLKFETIHMLLRSGDENCYVVLNKTKKRFFPFARIHYISNLELFLKYIGHIKARVCLRLRVCGLLISQWYLKNCKPSGLIRIRRPQPTLFKSDSVEKDDIDTLYSEQFLLNM
jgi:hypothetical protein